MYDIDYSQLTDGASFKIVEGAECVGEGIVKKGI